MLAIPPPAKAGGTLARKHHGELGDRPGDCSRFQAAGGRGALSLSGETSDVKQPVPYKSGAKNAGSKGRTDNLKGRNTQWD